MHGNLEPEESIFSHRVGDLYEDMERLNALYEELCWPHNDVLEFKVDYENDRIIITNKSKKGF